MSPNSVGGLPPEDRIDLRDPVMIAVKITELEGKNQLLGQQVTTGLKTLFDQIASLQGDFREVETLARDIHSRQHQIQEHSSGLERLAKAIERQTEFDTKWRKDHEAENKVVADRVTLWRGVIIGVCLLAGLLASATIYIVQSRFDDAAQERVRIDARLDRLEARP